MNTENPRKDIEVLQKWFPDLKGVESAYWQAIPLGSSKFDVPGPSTIESKGIIRISDEMAEQYWNQYDWKEVQVTLEADFLDLSLYKDKKWFYSKDFENAVKPPYYHGKFYFDQKEIWMKVMR